MTIQAVKIALSTGTPKMEKSTSAAGVGVALALAAVSAAAGVPPCSCAKKLSAPCSINPIYSLRGW
jgi:CBS-domain-containing membrane protein